MSVAMARQELEDAMRAAADRKAASRWRPPESCLSTFATLDPSPRSAPPHGNLGFCSHCCYCCFSEGAPRWQPRSTAARWLAKPEAIRTSRVASRPSPTLGELAARPWSSSPRSQVRGTHRTPSP